MNSIPVGWSLFLLLFGCLCFLLQILLYLLRRKKSWKCTWINMQVLLKERVFPTVKWPLIKISTSLKANGWSDDAFYPLLLLQKLVIFFTCFSIDLHKIHHPILFLYITLYPKHYSLYFYLIISYVDFWWAFLFKKSLQKLCRYQVLIALWNHRILFNKKTHGT